MFIFFACPNKTNQKKGSLSLAVLLLALSYPALLKITVRCETRFAQTVLAFFGYFFTARLREMASNNCFFL